jgi:hypothetical protein
LAVFFAETNWNPLSKDALSDLIYQASGHNNALTHILGTVLIFIQAVIIIKLVNSNHIVRENSMFPGIFYILIVALFPDFNYFSPVLLANTCLIIFLFNILNAYKLNGPSPQVFNAGLFIGIAMLLDFSYIVFFIAGLIGFSIVKAFKLRELLQYFIGFLIPIFLCGTFYFWNGDLSGFLKLMSTGFAWMDWYINWSNTTYVKVIIFGFICLYALLNYSSGKHNSVHSKRKKEVMLWFIAFGFLTFFIQPGIRLDQLLVLAVPVSILLSLSILQISNKQIAEVIHLILISTSFLFQYIL